MVKERITETEDEKCTQNFGRKTWTKEMISVALAPEEDNIDARV
jgi:hypothetical protein